MNGSEAAEILGLLCDGEDREPGSEETYLATLQAAATLDQVTEALRRLAELPCKDELERLGRREKAMAAVKNCPAKPSAPAGLVNAVLPLKLLGRDGAEQRGGIGLEDPEPWPASVAGAELLDEFEGLFSRHVALSPGGAAVLALWAAYTYVFDAFDTSPLLVLASPEKRCGKTTALTLLASVCRRAVPTSNVTPAVLYRLIEREHPTLLFDEADAAFGPKRSGDSREELRGILNGGHTRSLAFVLRCHGEDHEPRQFSTWAPKAVALIGRLPDTLEDRSIELPMRRKLPNETVARFRIGRLDEELLPLRRRAVRWAADHEDQLREVDPEIPAGLGDREEDNWRPLLAIADAAGSHWPMKAREAIAELAALRPTGDEGSLGAVLLADIREVFEQEGTEHVFTETILSHLEAREDRRWGEWSRSGKPITARGISGLLRPFGVRPRDVRIGEDHKKGYTCSDFADAWSRYVEPSPSATTRQVPNGGDYRVTPAVTEAVLCPGYDRPETLENTGSVTVSRMEKGGRAWEGSL